MKIVALCLWCLVASRQDRSREVILIIPSGTKGIVTMREDPKGVRPIKIREGVVLVVPARGTLLVKDMAFLDGWHTLRVYYEDHKNISWASDPRAEPKDGALYCWFLTSDRKAQYFFVGTFVEKRELTRQLDDLSGADLEKRGLQKIKAVGKKSRR